MVENDTFLLVNTKALPDIFEKVVEVKRLMASGKMRHVQEAVAHVGVSRSVFYKYRDSVFAYDPSERGKSITFAMNLDDVPGLLSTVLNVVAENGANVLTINQTIPIHTVANVTLTVESPAGGMGNTFEKIAGLNGVSSFKILNME